MKNIVHDLQLGNYMQIQPNYSSQELNTILKIVYSPQNTEGIYLVKRKGGKSPLYDHYGFAVSGKFLKNFNLPIGKAKVIHKIDTSVIQNEYDPISWEVVHKMPNNEIPLAILRTKLTLKDKYNLLSDNCEHFARYVTTGIKESSQVQNAFALAMAGLIGYLYIKD